MSNDDEKIPVATVAVEDEADRAPPVPVKISKVTMISAGRLTTLHLKMIRMLQVFPKWIQCTKAHHCCAWTRS